jgi:hypothetical protein
MMKERVSVFVCALLVLSASVSARTWHIKVDGSGDAPTISAGLDSASAGDTLLVEPGTHYEYDLHMKSGVAINGESAAPDFPVIDAQGQGRVIVADGVDATGHLEYLMFTGGHAGGTGSDGCGGGMFCTNNASPTLRNCVFYENAAENIGGGMYCENNSSPDLTYVVFRENQAGVGGGGLGLSGYSSPALDLSVFRGDRADGDGGGVHCSDNASPDFDFCVLINNSAGGLGACLYCEGGATPSLMRCILAFSPDGEAAYADDDPSIPSLECCDLYANEGGDWVGRIADQDSTVGNFSADPLFCDTLTARIEYTMESCSPCVYGNHPWYPYCNSDIGNGGPGCECGEATEPATWGVIKSLYR